LSREQQHSSSSKTATATTPQQQQHGSSNNTAAATTARDQQHLQQRCSPGSC